jgi:hypothetical protein
MNGNILHPHFNNIFALSVFVRMNRLFLVFLIFWQAMRHLGNPNFSTPLFTLTILTLKSWTYGASLLDKV